MESLSEEEAGQIHALMEQLARAVDKVQSVRKADIAEVKSMSRPPPLLLKTLECVLILLGSKRIDWDAAKRMLTDSQFLSTILRFDLDGVSQAAAAQAAPYLDDAEWLTENVSRVSCLGSVLCSWCRAVLEYDKAARAARAGLARAAAERWTAQQEAAAREAALQSGDEAQLGLELYTRVTSLGQMLQPREDSGCSDVRLLRASWMAKQGYAQRTQLPHRQLLEVAEPEAYVDGEQLAAMLRETGSTAMGGGASNMAYPPILVLSYCWKTPAHPDPTGSLLALLAPALEWYMSERAALWDGRDAVHPRCEPECAVFVDFWSLHQGERTALHSAAFGRALGRMDEW